MLNVKNKNRKRKQGKENCLDIVILIFLFKARYICKSYYTNSLYFHSTNGF